MPTDREQARMQQEAIKLEADIRHLDNNIATLKAHRSEKEELLKYFKEQINR